MAAQTPNIFGASALTGPTSPHPAPGRRVTFPNCECVGVPSGAFVRLASVLFVRDSIFE
jgi:hypothetical protein